MPKRKRPILHFTNVGVRRSTKLAIDEVANRRHDFCYAVVDDAIRAMIAGDESLADLAPVVKKEIGNEHR